MGHWTLINAVVYGEARRRAKPYVFCPAGALSIFGRSALLKTLYNAVTGRRIARDASACVAIARNESEQFQSYAVGADRLTIIPNGVDPEQFLGDAHAFRSKFGIGDVPFVLFMGRLNPIKGPDLLLRAFADVADVFPDIHLVFAGPDDGILQDLRRMAEESGRGSRVHFLGHVSGADKAGAYRATRLLAIPSRREAMSIVVLEAGICGTPVLMTDQCGFDEIDEAGGGRIVPATVDGLKSGLLEMLSDSARLSRMGQQLENHTRTNFLWEATATRYIELFNRVLRSAATS
jgi:glycosyltransferase involved in cell wall biosynthesis